jgi:hypothetical protein
LPNVAFRFGPEIPDQNSPVLRFRPLLLRIPEKGRFALENWAARKAAIHDASSSPGNGGVRQAGRAQPVPPGASWPVWLLCLAGRLAEALTRGQGQEATPEAAWLHQAASGTSVSFCDRCHRCVQADLHIESELSGPMPHFSGATV